MRNRRKPGDAYVDLIVRERGPGDNPELTIEIESSYSEEFKDALKSLVPWDLRMWDEDGRVWRIHPRFLLGAQELAKKYYKHAFLVVGEEQTDLHTGQSFAQKGLF